LCVSNGQSDEAGVFIQNDIEFILMQRKPGGYRQPTEEQRRLSMIPKQEFNEWFRQIWTLTGASTKDHPAPYPLELASRLVRMFSFHGDTVLDPFSGSGTTLLAAMKWGRNSIGIEIDAEYCRMAARRMLDENQSLFATSSFECIHAPAHEEEGLALREKPVAYRVTTPRRKKSVSK
jgi:DNA modification methylase